LWLSRPNLQALMTAGVGPKLDIADPTASHLRPAGLTGGCGEAIHLIQKATKYVGQMAERISFLIQTTNSTPRVDEFVAALTAFE
jgi:hypothetical protein